VVEALSKVPLRQLYDAGVPIALGANDPLLFGTKLASQYALAREVPGFSDAELAQLARYSIGALAAPEHLKTLAFSRRRYVVELIQKDLVSETTEDRYGRRPAPTARD
jgi:adenosine deaminase